jgi:preprotein translocase subunit SecG
MQTFLLAVHVTISLGLVALVLIQHGKGADAGAAFGSGASATVFGSRGASSFLTRATAILAALFFVNSLALAYLSGTNSEPQGLMEQVSQPQQQAVPQEVPAPVEVPQSSVPADVPKVGE